MKKRKPKKIDREHKHHLKKLRDQLQLRAEIKHFDKLIRKMESEEIIRKRQRQPYYIA